MNVIENLKCENYHLVLQKFINVILFGKVSNPNFEKSINVKLDSSLLALIKSFDGLNDKVINNLSTNYFDLKIRFFYAKLEEKDLLDIYYCYGFSNFRLVYGFFKIFNEKTMNTRVDFRENDERVLKELVWNDFFPIEIESFLFMQFFDLFKQIKYELNMISKANYEVLLNHYLRNYDYNEVFEIISK